MRKKCIMIQILRKPQYISHNAFVSVSEASFADIVLNGRVKPETSLIKLINWMKINAMN